MVLEENAHWPFVQPEKGKRRVGSRDKKGNRGETRRGEKKNERNHIIKTKSQQSLPGRRTGGGPLQVFVEPLPEEQG